MANIEEEKSDLLEEIVLHNKRVIEAEREYTRFGFLKRQRKHLRRHLISPRSEMEGEGLRKTYVAMGRAWLEDSHIVRWRRSNDRLITQRRMARLQKSAMLVVAMLVCALNGVVYYRTIREDVLPAFGKTMKRIRPDMGIFDDLTRFAKDTFSKMGKSGNSASSPDMQSLPPDLRMEWRARMERVRKSAETLEIERVLSDPDRRDVYYVVCKADLRGRGRVDFRLQCARRNGHFVFLALE